MKLSRKFLSYALVFATGGSAVLSTAAQAAPAAAAKKDDKKKGKTPPSAAPDAATPVAATPAKKDDPKKADERKGPASFNATAKPGTQTPEDAAREEASDKKRDEEIEQLKTVIKRIPADSGQKADLIFQLAELYYEKSKYLYSKEMRGYFAAQEELAKKQDRGEKVGEAKLDNSGSRLWRDEALRLYTQILKEYPTYERKDEVLFTLAYNQYEDLKTRPTAVQNYWSLIKQYPNSKFLYDAYVQLGEHFFAGNDLDKARKAYLEAFKSTNPKVHSFAQYKLAWCDYNAGDYQGAITRFKDVVDFTDKSAGGSDGKKDNVLKNEALNDVVQSFVQVEATDEAIQYFESKTSKKKAHRLTKKLASNMADGGKHDSAIKVYRRLLEADPMEEDAPSYQNSIVKSYEQLRKRDLVFKEMRVLVSDFGPKSKWAEANKKNEVAIRQAYEETEGAMRGMVTEYHREAQTTKDVATYKLASNIYKEYLDSFGESEYSFNLRFYHAEILYTLNHFAEAAEEYAKVVDAAPGEYGNKDYKKTAAYDTILCYEKLAADARGDPGAKIVELGESQKVDEKAKKDTIKKVSLKVEQKNLKEEEIPKWEKALADACDRYVKAVTDDKDEISLRYKAAFIYYDHHHDVEAASRFGDIINKWPQDKFSRQAADFTLNILENKEQWSELNRLSRAFYANKKLTTGDAVFTTRLATLVEGSQYKVDLALYDDAKKAQSQDKKFEAAVAFRDFQKEFPKSQYSAQALYASMVIFQDAGQLDKGIEVGQQLVKDYNDKPQANTALNSLGYYYTKTAQYPKSAEAYEAYVKLWEKAHGIVDTADVKKGAKPVVAVKAAPVAAKKPAAKPGEKTDDAPAPVDPVAELDKNVADALYNAALWHQGMGEDDKAIALFNKYVDYVGKKLPGFADKKDAPDVFLNIAKIHEKAHRQKETALAYEAYVTRFGKDVTPGQVFAAKYRQFVATRELHPPTVAAGKHVENPEVLKLMDDLSKSYVKLDPKAKDDVANIDAYGHVRFLQLEPMWKEYVAINFKNPARLVADLTDKLKRTDVLKNAYTDVLASRSGEWGIAALTRIGLAYEDFARDLIDSPDPKGLTEDQLGMYRSEIENKAFPLEDKAVEALEAALAKSSELKVYSDFTLQAQDQLNKVRPGAFGEVRAVAYRGSEVFVTAQPKLALVEVPKEAPSPTPPTTPPAGTTPPPAADPKAGSGSN